MNGIINVYKEKGFTSHDVVAKLRGILHQKKIGHTGTLDPEAEGVLPVCVGNATKVCDLLTDKSKEYETVLFLGVTTDTQDMTGRVLTVAEDLEKLYSAEYEEKLSNIIKGFEGDIMQVPPMYSALKVGGRKLYELAREGIEVERKPRPVTIHDIEILDMELPRIRMRVHCSKGTYIRTLCHDIGQKAGCGAAMESLKRTRVDRFYVNQSMKLSEIEELFKAGKQDSFLMRVDMLFEDCPAVYVKPEAVKGLMNGNCLKAGMLGKGREEIKEDTKEIRIYDPDGQFCGIYGPHPEQKGVFKPVKMFLT